MPPAHTLIVQSGFPRSTSTLLVNALYGMLLGMQYEPVVWSDFGRTAPFIYDTKYDLMIVKTHETDLARIAAAHSNYNLYFICSERQPNNRFDDKYRDWPNAVFFDYKELNEGPTNTLSQIISRIYMKVSPFLYNYNLNHVTAFKRVSDMNKRAEEIKDLPFDYADPFYQIHGGHRLRPHNAP